MVHCCDDCRPDNSVIFGAGLDRLLETRSRIVAYLGHVSGINLSRAAPPIQVNTHSVVIRNVGRRTATNVRIGHNTLPDYQVYPDIEYHENNLPGGGVEIVFPKLVPKRQVTVTYLYFPPLTWGQVNTHLESDEGPIKVLNVLPVVQAPIWIKRILWLLVGCGLIGALYALYETVKSFAV